MTHMNESFCWKYYRTISTCIPITSHQLLSHQLLIKQLVTGE